MLQREDESLFILELRNLRSANALGGSAKTFRPGRKDAVNNRVYGATPAKL